MMAYDKSDGKLNIKIKLQSSLTPSNVRNWREYFLLKEIDRFDSIPLFFRRKTQSFRWLYYNNRFHLFFSSLHLDLNKKKLYFVDVEESFFEVVFFLFISCQVKRNLIFSYKTWIRYFKIFFFSLNNKLYPLWLWLA